MDIYQPVIDAFNQGLNKASFKILREDASLRIMLRMKGCDTQILIQGENVPEMDFTFDRVTKYFSSFSTKDMVKNIEKLIKDINIITAADDDIKLARGCIFNIPLTRWGIVRPYHLTYLGLSGLARYLPKEYRNLD